MKKPPRPRKEARRVLRSRRRRVQSAALYEPPQPETDGRQIPISVDTDEIPPPTVTQQPPAGDRGVFDRSIFDPLVFQTGTPPPTSAATTTEPANQPDADDDIVAVEFGPGSNGNRRVVGNSVRRNKVAIILNVEALLLLLDEKLASLRHERPNSVDAQRVKAQAIDRYEGVKKQLEALRDATVAVGPGRANEAAVETAAMSFMDYVHDWFEKDHRKILNKAFDAGLRTFDAGLFLSCLGICSLVGCDATVATIVSGTLVGGGKITSALKAADTLIKGKQALKAAAQRRKGRSQAPGSGPEQPPSNPGPAEEV